MGLRTAAKRKALEFTFDAITLLVERYVRKNPGCRIRDVSADLLPGDYGKRQRLFMSQVLKDLVQDESVIRYDGAKFPRFYHASNL